MIGVVFGGHAATFSENTKHGDNPLVATVETIEKTPEFYFNPLISHVNCCLEKSYENERRNKLFQPNTEQIKDARAWLVRAIARRAVEILQASENPQAPQTPRASEFSQPTENPR